MLKEDYKNFSSMLDILGNTLANLIMSLLPKHKFTKDYNENN